jgi:predicted CXXCH cytochrome family protein
MGKKLLIFVLHKLFFLLFIVNQSFAFNNYDSSREKPEETPKCSDCHSNLTEKKSKHTPVKENCESCHKVNFKEHTENGSNGLHLAENIPALCYNCHNGLQNDLTTIKNIHQVIKNKNSCINCHNPHSSDEDKLLVLDEKKLCLSCHNKEVASNGKKTANINRILTNAKVIHPPVENGCIACHKPHASDNNYLLIT